MTITNYNLEKQNDYPVMKKIVSFLTAGLVDYSDVDDGKYLLRKEAIEKMLPTLEGRPLVIGHQKIDPEHLDDVAVGYITKGYWNPETGSFDCDVLVKDPEILNPTKNAVSCAYVATEFGEGGRYSGIDYDAEILNGNFTHIALVDNPRYNDAKILVNSLKGAGKMIKRFFSNADDEKKAEDEKKCEEETKELSPEDVVTVGDKDVTIKELVDCYVNACKKNEDKEEDKDDEKEAEDDEKKEEEKKDEDKEEKKNEDSDDELVEKVTKIVEKILAEKHVQENKKNEDDEKKDNEDKEEKQNSLSVAAMLRDYSSNEKGFETRAERIAESNKKYSL